MRLCSSPRFMVAERAKLFRRGPIFGCAVGSMYPIQAQMYHLLCIDRRRPASRMSASCFRSTDIRRSQSVQVAIPVEQIGMQTRCRAGKCEPAVALDPRLIVQVFERCCHEGCYFRGICRGRSEFCNPNGLCVLRVYARQVFTEIVGTVAVPMDDNKVDRAPVARLHESGKPREATGPARDRRAPQSHAIAFQRLDVLLPKFRRILRKNV